MSSVKSRQNVWDVIVVGAGVVGSWTAYHLAKTGNRVLILEQFHLPHTRGSSHGHSRLIRRLYDKEEYAVMMQEAYDLWLKLQRDSGHTLFKRTGMLVVEGIEGTRYKDFKEVAKKLNIPYDDLNVEELNNKYPLLNFQEDHQAMYDPSAGVLIPDKCQFALQETISQHGGMIRDGEKVEQIHPGSTVIVVTNTDTYFANSIVITPGPWANDVLGKVGLSLPIKTMPGWPMYWPIEDTSDFKASNGWPVVLYNMQLEQGYRFILITPEYEYPGLLKIASRGEPVPLYLHPDRRAKDDKMLIVNMLQDFVQKHLRKVQPKPAVIEPCMYTMTPDGNYIIDRHPLHQNIIIGAGFSGHGFKTAPVVGKLLQQLVNGKPTSYSIDKFKMDRFQQDRQSKL